jgi:hypothetical protein
MHIAPLLLNLHIRITEWILAAPVNLTWREASDIGVIQFVVTKFLATGSQVP